MSAYDRMIVELYRLSLKEGVFPVKLKTAFVSGIYKGSGNKNSSASSYKPLALTSHISKVIERVMRKEIIEYLAVNNLWDERQHGTRAGR